MKKMLFLLGVLGLSFAGKAQLKIGGSVPEINLPDASGDSTRLSGLKGKVVLIDFWASWCGPCRAANPYLQKLYKKYREQGFEIYAVSLDTKRESWLRAIKKDRLKYTLVLDLEGWNSKTAELFFVDALPTNFLLDRTGKIVAVNLEGKALFDAVKRLVK